MDNKKLPRQEGQAVRCTIDELLTVMEPVFQRQKAIVEKCINGLAIHAANLAVKGQEDDIPSLSSFVTAMAEFWDLETTESRMAAFEKVSLEARTSGQAPVLTEQHKHDILAGLELYAQEMRCNDPEMEEWAVNCENLADSLQHEWLVSTVEKCITGLTIHAANLAANQQENSVPGLDSFIPGMVMFFGLGNEDETAAAFEQAVTKARDSGQAPALTEQGRQDILAGLELYALEMRLSDPEMEECAAECEVLANNLQSQWQSESTEDMKMGGIT